MGRNSRKILHSEKTISKIFEFFRSLVGCGLYVAAGTTGCDFAYPRGVDWGNRGYVYGVNFGFLFSTLGLTLGSWIAFELASLFGRPLVEKFVADKVLEKLHFLTSNAGAAISFLLFIIPGFPKDYLCYILGLTGMNLSTFLVVSTLGRMPGTYLLTIQGASIGSGQYETAIVIAAISGVVVFIEYLYRSQLYHWIRGFREKDITP